jgi:hypothetical protein
MKLFYPILFFLLTLQQIKTVKNRHGLRPKHLNGMTDEECPALLKDKQIRGIFKYYCENLCLYLQRKKKIN